jgi:RHS repeat-associated protein
LTKPLGVVSAAPDDYQWDFEYDDRNLSKVIQPYADDGKRYFTTYTHNPDGTVESTTDPNGHTTTFGYDDNGLVTRVTQQSQGLDQNGNPRIPVTTFGYDADGELLWVQDPNHQKYSNSKTTTYRTYFYYDAFHRLVWQSTPRHTATGDPLIWMSTAYDPNDNVVAQTDAAQGAKFAKGPTSTSSYDDMDQVIAAVNPGSSSGAQTTKIDYDAAGRISTVTRPNGVASNVSKDFQTDYDYDLLDRVKNETTYLVNRTTGALDETVRTSFCYDFAGDLTRVLSPRATNRDCAAPTPQPFTTSYEYDPAHKRVRVVDGLGHDQKVSYDANDRVSTTEDAEHASTTYTYDQRDKTITLVEPFQTTPARTVTTKYVYDGAGNVTQLISPRAWDAAGGHAPFTNFVTTYHYNDLNQLTRIDLPRDADTIQAYVHRDYDLNGNLKTVTLPVTQSAPGSVPDSSKTDLTYLDPGWILASNDNVNPKVHFDYDPRGLQTVRVPEVKGSAGKLDTAHKVVWKYYPNRLLQSMKDAKSNAETYKYDLDDNLLEGKDSIGVTTSDESPMSIVVDPNTGYDTLDRLAKVKFKKNAESTWKSTNYVYDPNSNVERRIDNATEGQAGTGTIHTFTYDGADWLKRQIDDNSTGSDNADDQVIDNEWWPTGREKKRTIYRGNASTTPKQITNWTWYPNGLLQTLNTTTGDGTTVESHDVKYTEDSNVYVDGNRTRDTFKLDGPSDRTDQCRPSGTGCTAKWYYDGRDRLTRYDDGHGNVTTYGLDEIGNVKTETRGSQVTRYDYNGAQLKTKTDPSEAVHNYFYDNLGNLNCIMAAGYSRCPTGSDKAGLEVDYGYDPLNRMQSYAAYAGLTKTDSATYAYDALDRLTKESEIHQAGGSRTSSFTYMGLTSLATQEAQTGSSPTTKSYSYDAYGHRMSMTDSASSKTYSYGYDVHGSVSLLRDELNGSTKASYGYDAYGNTDAALTKGDTSPTNPTNPYRYQAARFDTGSQTTDMGARRFASNSLHFLQQDLFQGALDDLSLTSDPLTNNRYALAGGNPVQFKEWDGHVPRFGGGGMASFNPNPPQSSANTEPHRSFWGHIGGFFKGFAEQGADFVKGVGSMAWGGVKWVGACTSFNETNCAHGLNTAATAVSNLRHPTRVWRAYTASIRSDWRRGKKDEAAGRVGFEVLTFVIAAAKGVKAVKALRGAGAVDAATLGTAEGVSSQVIVDTNAVFNRAGVEAALNAGETPVITRTTSAELRNLVARGPLKMPRYAGELDGIEDVMDVNTRINIRGMLEGIRGGEPGLFGDGSIGATAINRGLPVITDDRNFASALEQLGVEVRRPV